VDDSVKTTLGIKGSNDSCLSLLSKNITCEPLVQGDFNGAVFLSAPKHIFWDNAMAFGMVHESSAEVFVIHILAGFDQHNGA
jgi:hypothetical protein